MSRSGKDIWIPIYLLDSNCHQQAAIDLLYFEINQLLADGNFEVCDELLQNIQFNRISTSLMRSILVITFVAKDQLRSRSDLFTRIKEMTTELWGPEMVEKLFGKLA